MRAHELKHDALNLNRIHDMFGGDQAGHIGPVDGALIVENRVLPSKEQPVFYRIGKIIALAGATARADIGIGP